MSESDSGREGVWLETYRPQTLDEVVGQEAIVERLEHYVESDDVPNMLFAGPAGVGKCVAGETPVLTDDGLARIETVVGDIDGFEAATDTRVLSLTGSDGFEYTAPSRRFAREAETRLEVRTRDGSNPTVTPEHRFLVRENGGFEWRAAADLDPGDQLARPLSAPLPPTETTLDPLAAMDGDRTLVHVPATVAESIVSADPATPDAGRAAAGSEPGGATTATARADTGVHGPERGQVAVPLATLRAADIPRETVRTRVRGFQHVTPENGRSGVVSLPWEVTPALAEFLGLLVGGGRIKRGRISFDGAAALCDRFDRLLVDLFGVDPVRDGERENPRVTTDSATVTQFVTACFDLFERDGAIGSRLLRADAESRRAFLRAAFDAGATVTTDGTVELPLDGDLATLCSYLLAGFGIPSGRESARAGVDRLTLPETHLDRLRSAVGFSVPGADSRPADTTDPTEGHDGTLPEENLYLDVVTGVEAVDGGRVYDLTVPGARNYVAGQVPTVMHNTTSAIAVARELYGENWEEQFMELNASDERGIDVIRDRVKSFARTSFGGANYRIIFLDESDALTAEAQAALRRTMEQFSNNVRFILSCNYSSQIIDPIQSRCAVFRFSPLGDAAIEEQVRHIATREGIELTDDGVAALVYVAGGDMRAAINGLQAAAVADGPVDESAVFEITSTARPEDIEAMVTRALDGDFTAARSQLDRLLTEEGIAGGDIVDQLHRSVWEFDLEDEAAVRLLDRIGEADYRITEGANERIQLEALLASVALDTTQ